MPTPITFADIQKTKGDIAEYTRLCVRLDDVRDALVAAERYAAIQVYPDGLTIAGQLPTDSPYALAADHELLLAAMQSLIKDDELLAGQLYREARFYRQRELAGFITESEGQHCRRFKRQAGAALNDVLDRLDRRGVDTSPVRRALELLVARKIDSAPDDPWTC